jgi:hypothetical protein
VGEDASPGSDDRRQNALTGRDHGDVLPPPVVSAAGSVVVSITVLIGAVTVLVGADTVTLTGGELVAGVVITDVSVVVLPPDARPIASPPPISRAAMITTTIQALLR